MEEHAKILKEDAAARLNAINVRQSSIVKAPAGSGKTELLVQRYLALLGKSCEHPKQLVAITFTRKAAAEMRRRLKEELLRAEPPTEEHKKRTYELAQEALRKVENGGEEWQMRHLIDAESVTTIDGFCRTLMALDADRAQFYDIPDLITGYRLQQMYGKAVEKAFDRLRNTKTHRSAMSELLYRHSNEVSSLIQNFAGLLEKRGDLLKVMTTTNYNAREELTQLADLLKSRLTDYAPKDILRQHRGLLASISKNIATVYGDNPSNEAKEPSIADWQALARALLTANGAGSLRKQIPKHFAQKEAMKALLQDLQNEGAFIQQLSQTHQWTQDYEDDELVLTDYTRLLFKESAAELMLLFRTSGCCDYTEVLLASQRVTGGDESPTLLAERLGHQLRHILVDEFQDTSSAQLHLLQNLSQSWDASDNNTLFLVGDPMQSVYSFRNANVRIFNHLWRSGSLGQVKLNRIQLSCNYRSGYALVNWFNANFANVLSSEEAAADKNSLMDRVGYAPSHATGVKSDDNSQGPMNCGIAKEEKSQKISESERYVPLIEQLKKIKNTHPKDTIAILASKRAQLIPLLSLLKNERLDFQAPEILGVSESVLINDLTSLLRCLHSRADYLAWYSLLRSPWCGLTLGDLYALAKESHRQNADIPSLLAKISQKKDTLDNLSPDGVQRLRLLGAALADSLRDAGRLRLSETLEKAWQGLGGRTLLKNEGAEEELSLFLRIVEDSSSSRRVDIAAVSSQLREAALSIESGEQIQIMTVHKAKGLEFDHVFLPNMEKSSLTGNSRDDTIRVLSFSATTDLKEQDARLSDELAILALRFPIDPKESRPARKMLDFIRRQREEQEQRRLFYVACTRARKGLYMHYQAGARKAKGAFISYIVPEELNGNETLLEEGATQRIEDKQETRLLARIPLAQRKQQMENTLRKKQAKQPRKENENEEPRKQIWRWSPPAEQARGLLIHRLMEVFAKTDAAFIKNQKQCQQLARAEIERFLPHLSEMGLPPTLLKRLAQEARDCIRTTLADERGQWMLAPSGADAHTEWAILLREGRSVRLDRAFLDEETRWIVDYKTFEPQNPLNRISAEREYADQLIDYATVLTEWQAKHNLSYPIKVGIYCPQNNNWFAWDYDASSRSIRPLHSAET